MNANESAANSGQNKLKPAASHIAIPDAGAPFLIGCRCLACNQVFTGNRSTCAKCGARGKLLPLKLAETGRIHTYSIVYRSFPGVKTPFVSAMVSLDGGGNVESTVRNVATNSSAVLFDLPVQLHFEVTNQQDQEGAKFLAYYFSPIREAPGDHDA